MDTKNTRTLTQSIIIMKTFPILTESEFLQLCIRSLNNLCTTGDASKTVNDVWAKYPAGSPAKYHAKPHVLYAASWTCAHTDPGFDFTESSGVSQSTLLISLLYHDAVYIPGASNNEELSAELAASCLRDIQVPNSLIKSVCKNIMCTKHDTDPEYTEGRCMVDADLSSLASPDVEVVWHDTTRLWQESGMSEGFADSTIAFLQNLAKRDVYRSRFMSPQDRYQAQVNIAEITRRLDLGLLNVAEFVAA